MQLATSETARLLEERERHVARGVGTAHPIFAARASGARVWDVEGREFFDFTGGIGVQNAGHVHPRVVAAIAAQSERLIHSCFQVAMYEPYVEVARRLNAIAPGPSRKKTLLVNTGAEAIENAVKIAREHTRRPAVIAFAHGYHGRTLLALTLTGKEAPYKQHFGPFCSDVHHAPYPHELHGWPLQRAIATLHDVLDRVGPASVAAFVIEPVLGEGGFVPAPPEFLHELRRLADAHGIVLVCDEVQTGFGRTGTMFALEHTTIEADLLCVAKSIAGGLPLAAVIGKAEIIDAPAPGGLGGTFAGNPVACAAALATLDIMDETFFARAREVGEQLWRALRAMHERYAGVLEVRGVGPMVAMELANAPDAAHIVEKARERGLLLLLAGDGNVIRVLVPLVINDEDLETSLKILEVSCEDVLAAERSR